MANNRTATPPPLHDLPTAKEKKYDRQLRLWGASGQLALEETHILLINNGPGVTGIETLKNLVLPGVGQFTILDSSIVDEADLGVNFFIDDSWLGKFRAEATVQLLEELNPDVKGYAMTEPLETWIARDKQFTPCTLIIVAAPIQPAILQQIAEHAGALQIPLFYTHCVGFYSHFSIALPSAFPIVDTHPDPTATEDLRLLKPWPALLEFSKKMTEGMDEMKVEQKGHIPYVCLLLHCIDEWRSQNSGKLPETYKEKTAVRAMVQQAGGDEENFEEAYKAVLKSLNPPTASSTVREILNAPEARNITSTSSSFWVIANAISQFYQKHGELPLPGSVPDMKAKSADYINLQSIYKSKAREDCAEVLATVRSIEETKERPSHLAVDEKEVENFCKGAAHIHLVRGRPLQMLQADGQARFGDRAKAMCNELTNPDSLLGVYVAFAAFDTFTASHSAESSQKLNPGQSQVLRVPGSVDSELDADTEKVTGIAHSIVDALIKEAGTFIEDPEYSEVKERVSQVVTEIVRAGGGELHNIASLTGGMVAQEVIKVITKQYVPVDNVCLFDGVQSKASVLRI